METLKFKSNIKCSGCVSQVTPFLNDAEGIENWEVDIADANKILTVKANNADNVIKAIEKSGFKIEIINQ